MAGRPRPEPFDLDAAIARAQREADGLPVPAGGPGASMQIAAGQPVVPTSPEMRNWLASVKRGRPAVAVAEAALGEGAVARVVRDPASVTPRLIVVSQVDVDDEVLALAQHVLRQSEVNAPQLEQRRTITIWRDRRVRVEEGTEVRTGRLNYVYLQPAGTRRDADALLARVHGAARAELPGVGAARVLPAADAATH